jgi:hypothetical protein
MKVGNFLSLVFVSPKLNFSRLETRVDCYVGAFRSCYATLNERSTKHEMFLSSHGHISQRFPVHLIAQVFIINRSSGQLIGYRNISRKLTNLLIAEMVNLPLYLIKHHDMKACGGLELYLHVFLTSASDRGEWSASRSGRFMLGERVCHTD